MSSEKVKTRILIISDTHGAEPHKREPDEMDTEDELTMAADATRRPTGYRLPLPEADVALHCGDLTLRSQPAEYARTFRMLRNVRAPLKLAIAGNHDKVLDEPYWLNDVRGDETWPARVKDIIDDARTDGVQYLTEGTHIFSLANGAQLKVYTSQYTPDYGGWGFQYLNGHDFDIPPGVDVAMTHGPPKAVLDYATMSGSQAGCDHLFRAVHHAKPQVHCFGHIHEAWGAYLARWREGADEENSRRATAIDEAASHTVEYLAALWPLAGHDEADNDGKRQRLADVAKQRGVLVDLTEGENLLTPGEQTLFVNAAIMDVRYRPTQPPWLVDIDLPKTSSGLA